MMNHNIITDLKNIWESKKFQSLVHSVWFFPAILTIVLIVLVILNINGSSIGVYYETFYGNKNDSALIVGHPQRIRSDEWIVNTQKTIAQKNDSYKSINTNVGNGEDETLVIDVPSKDWSTIFKPHNLGFLVLPFDNAFALKWWIMSYFVVLSSYFFMIVLVPKRKILAILLSLAMLFSPFIQWWYQYETLGCIYCSLFAAVVFMKLLQSKKRLHAVLWSILLAYIGVSFILILYPPFQIPCALVLVAFAVGYSLEQRKNIEKKILKRNMLYFFCAIVASLLVVGLFVYQKWDIITTIQNTAYPGQRIVSSGGYNLEHLMSSNLSPVLQSITRTKLYLAGTTNQSEASNFILLIPFLLIPALYRFYKKYKNDKSIDYLILSSTVMLIIILAWLFVPNIDFLGKITLLNRVPLQRLLIGLGLLNFIFIVGFIRLYSQSKERFSINISSLYALLVFIFFLLLDFHVMTKNPGFIGYKYAVLLALPVAVIVFCFMRKYFKIAVFGLLLFSILSVFAINPLYHGTTVLTQTPLSQAIRKINGSSNKRWVSEDMIIENFPAMDGERSLSGVYVYPQLDLWKKLANNSQQYVYNRYAHVNFNFIRDNNATEKPSISLVQADLLAVKLRACDNFLKDNDVGFLIASQQLNRLDAPCASQIQAVTYPSVTFYIYRLNF
jgi:hypothetical protein